MNALFAQAGKNPTDAEVGAMLGAMMVGIIIGVIIALVIAIFYLLTLSKALSRCSRDNRTMEPGMVWLNLIPLFNLVWQFITVLRVSESLRNEFESRGRRRAGDYGKGVGLAYCILGLLGIIPLIGPLFSLAGLVCFIMYWVKVAGFSGELARSGAGDDLDDEYDRPRRSRRDEADEGDGEEEERPRRAKKRDDNW